MWKVFKRGGEKEEMAGVEESEREIGGGCGGGRSLTIGRLPALLLLFGKCCSATTQWDPKQSPGQDNVPPRGSF